MAVVAATFRAAVEPLIELIAPHLVIEAFGVGFLRPADAAEHHHRIDCEI
jgi:hypothetical protein